MEALGKAMASVKSWRPAPTFRGLSPPARPVASAAAANAALPRARRLSRDRVSGVMSQRCLETWADFHAPADVFPFPLGAPPQVQLHACERLFRSVCPRPTVKSRSHIGSPDSARHAAAISLAVAADAHATNLHKPSQAGRSSAQARLSHKAMTCWAHHVCAERECSFRADWRNPHDAHAVAPLCHHRPRQGRKHHKTGGFQGRFGIDMGSFRG